MAFVKYKNISGRAGDPYRADRSPKKGRCAEARPIAGDRFPCVRMTHGHAVATYAGMGAEIHVADEGIPSTNTRR
jgi:hypothetical protein